MRELVRAFWNDQRGNIAILSTVGLAIGIGIAALGVDVGKVFVDRRKAQSAVDLGAIAAAGDLANAEKAARATVARNGVTPDTPVTVEYGVYTADTTIPVTQRFQTVAPSAANAARVTLNTSSPLFFARAFAGTDKLPIRTVATATSTAFTSFAIGSRLLRLEGGLLNQLLGSLLGANLSLSVMDYQALADVRLDLFDFMNAINSRARLTVDNYDQLLKASVKASDLVNAMADAERAKASGNATATRALSSIVQSLNDPTARIALGSVLDVGPYRSMQAGQKPQASVAVSMLDMLGAVAQIANGQRQIDTALDLSVLGIASVSLKLAIGERPAGTSWVTVGTLGASVHTAQTRLLLTIKVGGSGIIPSVLVPLYLEIGPATATLSSVTCGFPDANSSRVTLGVTPGVIDAWIGAVSNTEFTNFKTSPSPGPATLVNVLGSIKVTGRAHVAISNMSSTPATFSWTEIQQQTKKTVGTTNFAASLLSRLVGDLNLDVSLLGLDLGLGGATEQLVASILAAAVTPIDSLLGSVLSALGLGLGQADVWVLGLRCDGAVLVN